MLALCATVRQVFFELPIIKNAYAANASAGIGKGIQGVGLPERNKILMDFITDSVKGGRPDASYMESRLYLSQGPAFTE
jgi:hypothetical protein